MPDSIDKLQEISADSEISADTTNSDAMVGSVIGGHYRIDCEINSGAMGKVYKGQHQLLKKLVAIKVLLPHYSDDVRSLKRFQQEAKAATQLNHPNICAVREFGIHDNKNPFMVMDYVEGISLADAIASIGRLEQERALRLAIQMCSALDHAHTQGVVHRDIKPSNILLVKTPDGSEQISIVDFGIAKLRRDDEQGPDLTRTGEVFGTPLYMSPEQCLGKPVDGRSDIYSVACVFFELLTGNPPFRGDGTFEILAQHVESDPPLEQHKWLSAEIRTVLEHAMRKDPAQRYQSMQEFHSDLNNILQGTRPVLAQNRKTGSGKGFAIATVSILLAVLVFAICTFGFNLYQSSQLDSQWRREFESATALKTNGKTSEAMKRLNELLPIAEKSRDPANMMVTLQALSDVEESAGNIEAAKQHRQQMTDKKMIDRSRLNRLTSTFLQIAAMLILIGIGLVIVALLKSGQKGGTAASLASIFGKQKLR